CARSSPLSDFDVW
nr:immunoglobulin heavy chain junction region [Mus musculus]